MMRLDVPATSLLRAAELLAEFANEVGEEVVAEFNDIDVFAEPGDTPAKILVQYHRKNAARNKSD